MGRTGASKLVEFDLTARDRSIWDETEDSGAGGWKEVKGVFGVSVGASSRDLKLQGNMTVS